MNLSRQVGSWIEWTRDNLPATGPIPAVDAEASPCPWDEEGWLWLAEEELSRGKPLLHLFTERLAADPTDLPARFTALSVYHDLWSESEPDMLWHNFEDDNDDPIQAASEAIQGFRRDLQHLVGVLEPDAVPNDWRFVEWEIRNSQYAADPWDRGLRLYRKLEGLPGVDVADCQLMQAQFRYLMAFRDELEGNLRYLAWLPEVHRDDTAAVFLLLSGLRVGRRARIMLSENQLDILLDALSDLQKALSRAQDPLPQYRSILARCYLETGHFHDSIREYRSLLDTKLAGDDTVRQTIYELMAEGYQDAGETQQAIAVVRQWEEEFPKTPHVHKRLADLYAREANYRSAYEMLQKEAELDPTAAEDLGVRVALALGAMLGDADDAAERLRRAIEARPELDFLGRGLLALYWPEFGRLGTQAQKEWSCGSITLYYFSQREPSLSDQLCESAVKNFGKAVELELKARVFEGFQRFKVRTSGGKAAVERAFGSGQAPQKADQLAVFKKFMGGKPEITLGQMYGIMKECQRSNDPLGREFGTWLQKRYPDLLNSLYVLEAVLKPFGQAKHEKMSPKLAEHMAGWCRDVLKSLVIGQPG